MPQYKYLTKMIKKYENEIKSKVWINVFNVSEYESNQIWEIQNQTENFEFERFGRNRRIICYSKDRESVLNKIQEINSELKVEEEEFNCLKIDKDDTNYDCEEDEDDLVENLSFVNALTVQKLAVKFSRNVKFYGVANVKVLHVNACELQSVEGIQNWKQLKEINLDQNKLKSIAQLEGLTTLEIISLWENQIENLDPLKGLINLRHLDLNANQVKNVVHLKELANLTFLDLSSNQIKDQIIQILKTMALLAKNDFHFSFFNFFKMNTVFILRRRHHSVNYVYTGPPFSLMINISLSFQTTINKKTTAFSLTKYFALSHVKPPHRISVSFFGLMEFVFEIFLLITAFGQVGDVSYLFKVQTWEQCHKLTILFAIYWGRFSLEGNLYCLLLGSFQNNPSEHNLLSDVTVKCIHPVAKLDQNVQLMQKYINLYTKVYKSIYIGSLFWYISKTSNTQQSITSITGTFQNAIFILMRSLLLQLCTQRTLYFWCQFFRCHQIISIQK
ncbi:leucine-rich_repeat domain-containing protein [Hexamita inflata]|uniref:Leucine-rich repeat domain-containing protein n=1 Tax=Hexamita inflata TaxID=28002 RepID=A0AA86NP06_9EUKA|nr:leucine-rich repeat domain-containing protein [Hexamita inflata]